MEVHTLGLIRALVSRGYQVELVANRCPEYSKWLEDCGLNEGVRIINANLDGIVTCHINDRHGWKQLLREIRSSVLIFPKGDNPQGNLSFLRVCRAKFKKIIFIEHLVTAPPPPKGSRIWLGFIPGPGLWRRKILVYRRICALFADRMVAVSCGVKDRLVKDWQYSDKKIAVVPNGVAWREFDRETNASEKVCRRFGLDQDEFVFGILARLTSVKGIDIALRALQRVAKRSVGSKFRLVIAGEGEEEQRLKTLARELDVERYVSFIGFLDDPKSILARYDVIVFPSRKEGLPIGLLEAMASGCVPIVTCVGGMPEAVNSAEIGWVVPAVDPEALAQAMIEALNLSNETLRTMRHNAVRQISRHFDLDESHRRIIEVCGL